MGNQQTSNQLGIKLRSSIIQRSQSQNPQQQSPLTKGSDSSKIKDYWLRGMGRGGNSKSPKYQNLKTARKTSQYVNEFGFEDFSGLIKLQKISSPEPTFDNNQNQQQHPTHQDQKQQYKTIMQEVKRQKSSQEFQKLKVETQLQRVNGANNKMMEYEPSETDSEIELGQANYIQNKDNTGVISKKNHDNFEYGEESYSGEAQVEEIKDLSENSVSQIQPNSIQDNQLKTDEIDILDQVEEINLAGSEDSSSISLEIHDNTVDQVILNSIQKRKFELQQSPQNTKFKGSIQGASTSSGTPMTNLNYNNNRFLKMQQSKQRVKPFADNSSSPIRQQKDLNKPRIIQPQKKNQALGTQKKSTPSNLMLKDKQSFNNKFSLLLSPPKKQQLNVGGNTQKQSQEFFSPQKRAQPTQKKIKTARSPQNFPIQTPNYKKSQIVLPIHTSRLQMPFRKGKRESDSSIIQNYVTQQSSKLDYSKLLRHDILNKPVIKNTNQKKTENNNEDSNTQKLTRQAQNIEERKNKLKNYLDENNDKKDFGRNDPIVQQGEIYRFKPGIENNFISRWVQVSNNAFRYFRNQYQSFGLNKPIVSIPIRAIEDVSRIEVNTEAFFRKRNVKEIERTLFQYMFEVYLRDDYEDIFNFRDEEVKQKSLSPLKRNESDVLSQARSVNNSFYQSQERKQHSLYRYKKQSEYTARSVSRPNCNQDDLFDLSNYNKKIKQHEREKRVAMIDINNRAEEYEHDKVNRIVKGHLMAIRDYNLGDQKKTYLEDFSMLEKNFGDRKRNINIDFITNASSWTNRAIDWYNSERRLVFATTSEEQREAWMGYFKGKQFIESVNKDNY
ncbi:UNKNOWN [Stylonychia lemnae]|uniref:Uncharacterized protein n=1 Tax=Stylonychia lemnae TaxID=5949 RepID=A0A078B033_STYLE|nr:UNKNOWN [Stylonychia lemnae]|eukprot:CDW87864.1 UNKNOWN [Stylonychia lemnae]